MDQCYDNVVKESPGMTDSNCGDGVDGKNFDEDLDGSPTSDEAHPTVEVDSIDSYLKDLESRLECGQIVDDEHIAYALYCKYASVRGFSVRKGKTVKFKDGCGLVQGKWFYCHREGTKDDKCSKNKIPDYQKKDTRIDCKARLKVARKKGDVWKVTAFEKEHNHELYEPDETYLLRSSRKLTDEQEVVLSNLVKYKIPISKSINFLESIAHGKNNVGFTEKDAYDCLQSAKRRTKIDNGEAHQLVQHFLDKANKENNFYWNVEVDDEKRLMNIFCRDFQSLLDYEKFGDVLSIDTTYKTNHFELSCALFVGINHHGENILFGFALMSNENETSFEWLFRIFLESMGGKQPETIFTDQCKAMMNAVGTVFELSFHRLCQWHINQNAPSHFGSLNSDSRFKYLWNKCMNYCGSEEEFEATWKEMMDYDINNRSWFDTMYELRAKWVSTFSDHKFSGGLHTTSRSEGSNSAYKKLMGKKKASLLDCVIGYEELQVDWREKERLKDISCNHSNPSLFVSSNPLLKHGAAVYTMDMFNSFAKQLQNTMGLEQPQPFVYGGSTLLWYKVKAYGEKSRINTVGFDCQSLEIMCSCHRFETVGILCCHALKVLDIVNMQAIPEQYIKKRWTKAAKSEVSARQGGRAGDINVNPEASSYLYEMAFVNHATKDVNDLAMRCKSHVETRDILANHIKLAKADVDALFEKLSLNKSTSADVVGEDNNSPDDILVQDPHAPKARGLTNVRKRHFEVKSKKGKGKSESSKRTAKGLEGN